MRWKNTQRKWKKHYKPEKSAHKQQMLANRLFFRFMINNNNHKMIKRLMRSVLSMREQLKSMNFQHYPFTRYWVKYIISKCRTSFRAFH